MPNAKELIRQRRKNRIKAKVNGSAKRPRLAVFRSLDHIYAQIIDDEKRVILAQASDLKAKSKSSKMERAKSVGTAVAEIAKSKNITKVVFDRSGYKYHGRVKSLAEGAREGGLEF